ncbi:hypothetical protein ACFQX6_44980 [Streptosporangium lutulentum]
MNVRSRSAQQGHPGELRLPAACAVLVAIALYAALPSRLIVGPRFVVPVLELVLLVVLVAVNPRRMLKENRLLRRLSIALVLIIAVTNSAALVLVIIELVSGHASEGRSCCSPQPGVADQHHHLRAGLLGARPRRPLYSAPRPGSRACRWPTSAFPRTRTTTPSRRWPPARRPSRAGPPGSSTTSTCR